MEPRPRRPRLDICPRQYCFHWVPPGGSANLSGQLYDSLADALADGDAWVEFPAGGCDASFGPCRRLSGAPEAMDCYEPCEPELERDGLPWFFFMAAASLGKRARRQFESEARALWGDDAVSAWSSTRHEPDRAAGGPHDGA